VARSAGVLGLENQNFHDKKSPVKSNATKQKGFAFNTGYRFPECNLA
jgi:hypothetical protein